MIVDSALYLYCKRELIDNGYRNEIAWQANIQPCNDYITFRDEAVWVILNSGMKEQVARIIANRIIEARKKDQDISTAFGHKGKVKAIKEIFINAEEMFDNYLKAEDKISYLKTIPFIGNITKWHLAKNLGVDCIKPDRHLVRIAKNNNTTPELLCQKLSEETGDKISVVDIILWRSANLGMI